MSEPLRQTTVAEILETMAAQRIVRAYRKAEKPPRHLVRLIVNVGASAIHVVEDEEPLWKFIVTDDSQLISAMAREIDPRDSGEPDCALPDDPQFNPKTYFKNAPWVVVMLGKFLEAKQATPKELKAQTQDMWMSFGAAIGGLTSAAHFAGVAAGWISCSGFEHCSEALDRLLEVTPPWKVVAIIPLGYPAELGKPHTFKFDEMVKFQ